MKNKAQPQPLVPVTLYAVTVEKNSRLETEAFELTIIDGVVVEKKSISRAPDVQAITIGRATARLWELVGTQRSENYREG